MAIGSFVSPKADIEAASEHLRMLHGNSVGWVSLNLLGTQRRERHVFFTSDDLTEADNPLESHEAVQDVIDAGWNIYVSCSTFKDKPEKGRGNRDNVSTVCGVWADLDVKPDVENYFHSEQEIEWYIKKLPTPTIDIKTGSGGRHLYWLTEKPMSANVGQKLLIQWRDFLLMQDEKYFIDNVHDTTRILRLAGTVRHPKSADDPIQAKKLVTISSVGPRYKTANLTLEASQAHEIMEARRIRHREDREKDTNKTRTRMNDRYINLDDYDRARDYFNATQDWGDILKDNGWILHSDTRDSEYSGNRCRYWIRPGKDELSSKSACTDFRFSEDSEYQSMTLYSQDSSLNDLHESLDASGHFICSKWHFVGTRFYGGKFPELYRDVKKAKEEGIL